MLGISEKYHALAALVSLPSLALGTSHDIAKPATGYPPCDALISAGLGDRVILPTSDAYEPRVQSFWYGNGRLRPWCFLQPHTAEEVSTAVTALHNGGHGEEDWNIAVRSGGHGPPGTNNIANGVTIDLGMMNSAQYDPGTGLARVEPGAAWKDIYFDLLDQGNVTAIGGRDGDVGVGGFLLGGGMSYYTPNEGFSCDQVVNFEVVLSNGTITNANSHQNPDLWRALKGGGFNFGIVTAFDLLTLPAIDLAYGQSIVSQNYSDAVLDAVVEFTNHPQDLSDDALIPCYSHDPSLTPLDPTSDYTILLIRTNAAANLDTQSFENVTKIPTLTPPTWNLTSHAKAANDSQVPAGTLNSQRTLTLPNCPETLRKAASLHHDFVKHLSNTLPGGSSSFETRMFLQPLPHYIHAHSVQKGGNMLNLDPEGENLILFVAGVSIIDDTDEASFAIAATEMGYMVSEIEAFALAEGGDSDSDSELGFVYMNYADPSQDPIATYGDENVAFMKGVAKEVDPSGFWERSVPGGFKLGRD
ncbi:hypothetical protein FQN54_006334 [Arachnomyces sp. PD_36]|nr:hypothetical protein FQN54_006334 [Arachnomyces sp. PD_36]